MRVVAISPASGEIGLPRLDAVPSGEPDQDFPAAMVEA
jgi:hypothetical protein